MTNEPHRGFRSELTGIINFYSLDSESDSPDFILAEFLEDCLDAFDKAVNQRERFFGRKDELVGTP